jgi:hypothetical protein
MGSTFSHRHVTQQRPLVTITAETRDAIARTIQSVLTLAPGRDWEAAIAAVMTALEEANAWHQIERAVPRAANRREELRAVAAACRILRTQLQRLSGGAVSDLLESDAAGTREGLATQVNTTMKSLDPVASILVSACELMERRATTTAARLDRHRQFKPRSDARSILIHRLRDIYFGFNQRPTQAMTDRARALAQAKFVRAIFKAADVTCHAALVANHVKELEAQDLYLFSGNLG